MNGRIETYLHSDISIQNKCGSMVRITCQSEQGAKTEEFIGFCKDVAKYSCGFNKDRWIDLIEVYPDIEVKKNEIQKILKEKIEIKDILLLAVTPVVKIFKKFDIEKTKTVNFIDTEGTLLPINIDTIERQESLINDYDLKGHVGEENCSGTDVSIEFRSSLSATQKNCTKDCCSL
jgi:hypothetical protein